MNPQITLNQDHPVFYKYLTLCALEKRGRHQLTDISKDKNKASKQDIDLLAKYLELAETNINHTEEQLDFLKELQPQISDSNQLIEIHLTRDYQVVETGNHYVTLVFKLPTDKYINNIKFTAKFNQRDTYPVGDKIIRISYFQDFTRHFPDCRHTIQLNDNLTYHRKTIGTHLVSIDNSIITDLPAEYLIQKDYIPTPDLSLEACLIS